jgi:hypothetical protein
MTPSPSSLYERLTKPVQLNSAEFGRFYQVEGLVEPVPSVTHVLSCLGKPALMNWAASEERKLIVDAAADLYQDAHGTPLMLRAVYTDTLLKRVTKVKAHQKALAKAGEVGTQVHNMAEWFLRKRMGQEVGPEPPLSPEAAVAFTHFQNWIAETHLRVGFLETPVWSTKYGYAGTMDVYGWVGEGKNPTPVVIDFKTSGALYPEYHLQVAAYIAALREMKCGYAKTGFLVRFPKKPTDTFEVQEVTDWRARFAEFKKVRAMFSVWYAWERAYQEKRQAAKVAAPAKGAA